MHRTITRVVLLAVALFVSFPARSECQGLDSPYDNASVEESLLALLAQHGALDGHALARKSVRSPSRRLRFGRRSDPDMLPQAPLEEAEELLGLREARAPVRLRFGRRSAERAVPHVFPQEEQDRAARAPSMRLRFGRRSDNNMFVLPFEQNVPKDVKLISDDAARLD